LVKNQKTPKKIRRLDGKTPLDKVGEGYRLLGVLIKRPRITKGTSPAYGCLILQQQRDALVLTPLCPSLSNHIQRNKV
ncbi:hypothetical protein, partial [Klebsiella pneumoniae]|uniref:hypothetical protein n=1 Tax=Klebsiella pneumoniae TaxID=573 RepID=UPI0039C358E3